MRVDSQSFKLAWCLSPSLPPHSLSFHHRYPHSHAPTTSFTPPCRAYCRLFQGVPVFPEPPHHRRRRRIALVRVRAGVTLPGEAWHLRKHLQHSFVQNDILHDNDIRPPSIIGDRAEGTHDCPAELAYEHIRAPGGRADVDPTWTVYAIRSRHRSVVF
ncbi:hypothetical protein BC936DRAFT_141523 [Jimgerdemannia flammicorona]|uniref:Uncharacterized protein n=1 Tax=Jimgerdemannia flammicorona TaxID=994334 RepID=A0A433DG00_9FUNG|nr:hypothetical protein BC936DRAFT_141523 [Jimgerdemannia flammicorona]